MQEWVPAILTKENTQPEINDPKENMQCNNCLNFKVIKIKKEKN